MANGDQVRVEYPEGDYSDAIDAAETHMRAAGREEIRRRHFPERLAYSSADIADTHNEMQRAAEEGMRLRRSRQKLRDLGAALSESTKRPAQKKRAGAKKRD